MMAEGKRRHDWDQTSNLLALLANCHRDPKKTRPFTWQNFHPMEAESATRPCKGIKITSANISILKHVFVDNVETVHHRS